MEIDRQEGAEENLAERADIIASTSNSSNGGSPTSVFVGDVDERVFPMIENNRVSTSAPNEEEVDSTMNSEKSIESQKQEQNNVVESPMVEFDENPRALATKDSNFGEEEKVGYRSDHIDSISSEKSLDGDNQIGVNSSNGALNEEYISEFEESKKEENVDIDTSKNELNEKDCSVTSVEVTVDGEEVSQLDVNMDGQDYHDDDDDDDDDLDLDALLGDSTSTNVTLKNDDNVDSDINHDEDIHVDDKVNIEDLERNPSDLGQSSVISQDEAAMELDDILGDNGSNGSVGHGDDEEIENNQTILNEADEINGDGKKESSHGLASGVVVEDKVETELDVLADKVAMELDALLDDSDDEADGFVVIEEEPSNLVTSKMAKNLATYTNADEDKMVSKPSHSGGMVDRKQTSKKESMVERINTSPSISSTTSNSKKKIITTRDLMKDYSRLVSSRASNELRKDIKLTKRGNEQNVNSKPQSVSSTTKRLFMSSVPTSMRKVGGAVGGEEKGKRINSLWGENLKHYMKSTATFTNKVLETQIIEENKTKLKEINAKKIIVNMAPWKMRNNLLKMRTDGDNAGNKQRNCSVTSPKSSKWKHVSTVASGTISSVARVAKTELIQRKKARERESEMKKRAKSLSPRDGEKQNTSLDSRIKNMITFPWSPQMSQQKSPRTFMQSYAEQSVGSLSSRCTVASFVSPRKEVIVGCQKAFDPFLHKTRGPCELCIFHLTETEKEELDAKGRHLLVQFTTGGCQGCSAFQKSIGECQVRLCRKCYSDSHRPMHTRTRKKGNGSVIGYSFAKVSRGKIR